MRLSVLWEVSVDESINNSIRRIVVLDKPLPEISACYSYIDRIFKWAKLYKEDVKTTLVFIRYVCLLCVGNHEILTRSLYLSDKLKNKLTISLCIGIIIVLFHMKRKYGVWIYPFMKLHISGWLKLNHPLKILQ